jgi:hypothetical protein
VSKLSIAARTGASMSAGGRHGDWLAGLLVQKTPQLFVGPRRNPTDRVPLLHQLVQQQQTLDVLRAILASPFGAFRHNGFVAALPSAQRVQAKAGNFCHGSNRIAGLHP